MEYKALTYINLPLLDIKKAPGDTITFEEFEAGGQTEEDILALLDGGAISDDLDAPLLPEHQPQPVPLNTSSDNNVVANDLGKGVANE